ncbi:MAG: hypothetical protein K8S55_11335 [Phycisphaerae bacterium]|nr:hypothetical protein [Phycisphaerae bacterium]
MNVEHTDMTTAGQKFKFDPAEQKTADEEKSTQETSPELSDSFKAVNDDKGETIALQALVSSVRNDFAAVGMVPPPRNFAGMSVVTNSDVQTQGGEPEAGGGIGATDRMRMIMVKQILAKMVRQETSQAASSPSSSENCPPLDMAV